MLTLNTNSHVSVALTDEGRKVLNDYILSHDPKLAIQLRDFYKDNNDGKLTMQMHKLMLIFDNSCYVGNENLFKDNIIYLNDIVYLDEADIANKASEKESSAALDWEREGKELKAKLPDGSCYVVWYSNYANKPYVCGLYDKNENRIDGDSFDIEGNAIEWCESHYNVMTSTKSNQSQEADLSFEQAILKQRNDRKLIRRKIKDMFKDATSVYVDFNNEIEKSFKYLVLYKIEVDTRIEVAVFTSEYDPYTAGLALEKSLELDRQVCDDTVLKNFRRRHGDFDSCQILPR